MFTVQHEHPDGRKDFHKVVRPQFVPTNGDALSHLDCLAGTGPSIPDAFIGKLQGGVVYIMNERGATVGTFRLGR